MSLYLHDIPLDKAKAALQSALEDANLWRVLATENIPLDENALGRVLAEPIWAKTHRRITTPPRWTDSPSAQKRRRAQC